MTTVKFVKSFIFRIQKSFEYEHRAEEIVYGGLVWNKLAHDFSTGHLLSFINLQISYKAGLTPPGGLP
jgi:hypothetical protein